MKMKSRKVERRGDRLTVSAKWTDKLRQPSNVRLVLQSGEMASDDETLIEGDIRDVNGVLYAIAEIAWAEGWRPRGLLGSLARFVETYKLPPEQK